MPAVPSQSGSKLRVILAWVSVSTTRTLRPFCWQTPAMSQAVCVLPTPPFRLMTVMAVAGRRCEFVMVLV